MRPLLVRSAGARVVPAVAAAASVTLVVVSVVALRPGHLLVGSLFVLALIWSAAPAVIDVLTTKTRSRERTSVDAASLTVIIRLGDEHVDVARTSIVLAAASCPTIVVSTSPRPALEDLGPLGVRVCVAETIEAAVHDAAMLADTHAVLIHSASAYPRTAACRAAAAQLGDRVGWIVGSSRAFNQDGYAPEGRETVSARLRKRARSAGLDLWERDAIVVRTDLLRSGPIDAGRPWGAWLRRLRRDGIVGREHAAVLTERASPAGADAYWATSVLRKRALAADLADAAIAGAWRARLAAVGLLLRELHAYPLMVWVLAPLWVDWGGEFPFRASPWVAFAAVVTVALLRWLSTRLAASAIPRPVEDALGVTYDVPGSLLALPAALTRRVRPTKVRLPDRPHVWVALLLVLLLAVPLADRSPDAIPSRFVVAIALANLALLWVVALRALLQRAWIRTTYRFPRRMPVTIDGTRATTLDASPAGLAVVGAFAGVEFGRETRVELTLSDGTALEATGTVVDRRHRPHQDVLGLSLRVQGAQRARWYADLFRGGTRADARVTRSTGTRRVAGAPGRTGPARLGRVLERTVIGLVGVTAVLAAGALFLLLVGYRPLVVRSGSMVPALRVGDLAIVEDVPAASVRVGDIVTFDDPEGRGDTITHRVREMQIDGVLVRFETRGDANADSERWAAGVDEVIGRYSWRVPAAGRALVALATPEARAVLGGTALLLLAAPVARRYLLRAAARG
jgi:signal peptidase